MITICPREHVFDITVWVGRTNLALPPWHGGADVGFTHGCWQVPLQLLGALLCMKDLMVPLTESPQFNLVCSQGPVLSFWTLESVIESPSLSFLFV